VVGPTGAASTVAGPTGAQGPTGATGPTGTVIYGVVVPNLDTATSNISITAGYNGASVGPITVNTGVTITVATGQRWVIT
jgi:hypothetical protein